MLPQIESAISVLERTPNVLDNLLQGLGTEWTHRNEGDGSWSPYDVIGHLIHGEKTDWIPRARIILDSDGNKEFEPFDRFAQEKESKGKSTKDLLKEFRELRALTLKELKSFELTEDQLSLKGIHPEFGEVTLGQLISTWVVHDLGHIAQITRVMARQYTDQVGPWKKYLSILNHR